MMTTVPSRLRMAVLDVAGLRRDWVVAIAAFALGLGALGWIYQTEIGLAVYSWGHSLAYNHCYLVLPVAIYLAWDHRQVLAAMQPRPAPLIALLAVPVAVTWFAADRLGIIEGRQLVAMTTFQIMVAALFGLGFWRAFATPLLYLFFLVPFGYFILPTMQDFTVHFTVFGLNLLSVANFAHGHIIEIPEGQFSVELECSGLRFLMAMAAISIPYGYIMYTSVIRRTAFVVVLLFVAVIGNCFRVLLTILAGHYTGNVMMVENQHQYWGWAFYVVVGMVMLLAGARYAQERPAPPAPVASPSEIPPHIWSAFAIALATIVLLAAAPRVAADYLDRPGAVAVLPSRIDMPVLPGCIGPLAAAAPAAASPAVASGAAAYRCNGDNFVLALYRFPARIDMRPLLESYRMGGSPVDAEDEQFSQTENFRVADDPGTPIWRVTTVATSSGRFATSATALWIDGRTGEDNIALRVRQALNSVSPVSVPPVLAVVAHDAASPDSASEGMRAFLRNAVGLPDRVRQLLGTPAAH